MPFICSLCGIEIGVGEAMVPNIRMEVAHDRCVQKEVSTKLPEVPSDVTIQVQPDPRPVEIKILEISGPGFGNKTASLEPRLLPTPTKVCSECGDPCISMCPSCRTLVCQAYGWNGKFCGVAHEGKCSGARALREPVREVKSVIIGSPTNGKHVAPKKAAKRGRR